MNNDFLSSSHFILNHELARWFHEKRGEDTSRSLKYRCRRVIIRSDEQLLHRREDRVEGTVRSQRECGRIWCRVSLPEIPMRKTALELIAVFSSQCRICTWLDGKPRYNMDQGPRAMAPNTLTCKPPQRTHHDIWL